MMLDDVFRAAPLVAILRGLKPTDAVATGDALYDAGVRLIEVPLNSPEPFNSISRLAQSLDKRALCGAGTVLRPQDVDAAADAGAHFIVAPDTNREVIARTLERGLVSMPGFATASEAFTAWRSGARYLKLFPASTYGVDHMKALNAVLPQELAVLAVGGVTAQDIPAWCIAGAKGFGIGSEIYKPGQPIDITHHRAAEMMRALRTACF